jgi:hypothetical protein
MGTDYQAQVALFAAQRLRPFASASHSATSAWRSSPARCDGAPDKRRGSHQGRALHCGHGCLPPSPRAAGPPGHSGPGGGRVGACGVALAHAQLARAGRGRAVLAPGCGRSGPAGRAWPPAGPLPPVHAGCPPSRVAGHALGPGRLVGASPRGAGLVPARATRLACLGSGLVARTPDVGPGLKSVRASLAAPPSSSTCSHLTSAGDPP